MCSDDDITERLVLSVRISGAIFLLPHMLSVCEQTHNYKYFKIGLLCIVILHIASFFLFRQIF